MAMRLVTAALGVVLLLAASTALRAGGEKGDEKKVLGTWAMVSGVKSGEDAPDDLKREFRLIFAAEGKLTVKLEGKDLEGTYKLNGAKKPKEVDFTVDGKDMPGIYALDGDNLKICVGEEDNRPKEFASEAGSKTILLVLKREKKE
jgi:uncharacterized protein (TIGR03067 family)